MRLRTMALSAALLSFITSPASAIEADARITFIDSDAGTVWLNNGDTIVVPEGFDISTLAVAMMVTATYDETGTEPFQATELTIVQGGDG